MSDTSITALILAPDDSGLQPVFRVPAIRRLVILLERAGIRRVYILGNTSLVKPVLSDLLVAEAFYPVENSPLLDQLSPALGRDESNMYLVLRGDLVIDRDSLQRMLAESGKRRSLFMPVSTGEPANGLYLVGASHVAQVLKMLWSPLPDSVVPSQSFRIISGSAGLPCPAGPDNSGRLPSEDGLVRTLSSQTKEDDGFMARHVDRRISQYFSRHLAHTLISPNHITIAGMMVGMLGAYLFSLPGYWAHVLGAFLFVLCVIIDGMDGEVARLKLMESNFGHTLDIVTDNIVHVSVFIGIAIGLYRDTGNPLYIHALLFLMGGFAMAATVVYFCILKHGLEAFRQSAGLRLLALLINRDFAYLVFILALFHRLDWFLLGATAGSYIFAALVVVIYQYNMRQLKKEVE